MASFDLSADGDVFFVGDDPARYRAQQLTEAGTLQVSDLWVLPSTIQVSGERIVSGPASDSPLKVKRTGGEFVNAGALLS